MRPYHFRPYTKDDINFIHSSWGQSYYRGSGASKYIKPKEFHHFHRPIRERILLKPTVAIIIAASNEDPTQILGWILIEAIPDDRFIIHYAYVKDTYNNQGIFTDMLVKVQEGIKNDLSILCSHLTAVAKQGFERNPIKYERFKYQPHLI